MIYDPLREEFEKLEASVRERDCAHDDQPVGYERDDTWKVCRWCGRVTAGVGEYAPRTRADLDRAMTRATFLPTMGRVPVIPAPRTP